MRSRVPWNEWSGVGLAALALVLAGPASGQALEEPDGVVLEVRESLALEGFVLDPQGNPAEGAVVVSSAGGKAVTDVDGSYRLVLAVPLEATSVQITAVGRAGSSLVASASVGVGGIVPVQRVDPLRLALGTSCSPSWLPTFGAFPGTDGAVYALEVLDDGSGLALYVGGDFTRVAGTAASCIAKWDGASWTALASGMSGGFEVSALAVYDDGGGLALFAGGLFASAGGVPARNIAKWDGTSWSALGSGMNDWVRDLAVYDDGSGPALYAGGNFDSAGGVAASRIARWDGVSWTPVGTGMNGSVLSLTTFDDGGGSALFAGGSFSNAGGVTASRIAKWNGSSWTGLSSGTDGAVNALEVYDDGSGSALYAGGSFTIAGGVSAERIARWNGAGWAALGSGLGSPVYGLTVHDDGAGPELYAGGKFTLAGGVTANRVARWNGSSWAAVGSGMLGSYEDTTVYALAFFDDGNTTTLYAGGSFESGTEIMLNLAKWDGASWTALGKGTAAPVSALAVYDDGSGPALFAGFTRVSSTNKLHAAKWDGSTWTALVSGPSHDVFALAVFDDGSGPALFAGGSFQTAGGVGVNHVARWDGSSWSPLGSGIPGDVFALVVFDDGSGPALYAGGRFTIAGGVPANYIARWNGSSWSPLGSGVNFEVRALVVFDDGSGPVLCVAGFFTTAGGVPASRVASWNGSSWSPLGSGLAPTNYRPDTGALAVHDDGSGPALYFFGTFRAAGVTTSQIMRWDGATWSALGSGMSGGSPWGPWSLLVHDDGGGPALFAGGSFTTAGGVAANGIAKWDGSSWSALGSGLTGGAAALAVYDDGSGPALFAGGAFPSADSGDGYLAKWGCEADTTAPVLACPLSVTRLDRAPEVGEIVSFTVTATDDLDPAPVVVCVPPSGSFFPRGTTLVTCTATDAAGNQATCEFPVTVNVYKRSP
jgi:HYR domain-containing protein